MVFSIPTIHCMVVPSIDISEMIRKLKIGKFAGPDGICAESLIFVHDILSVLLFLCFSLICVHVYLLPSAMTETCIIPIIKNKCCNLSDSTNYRYITLGNIISKVIKSVILLKCENCLITCNNQSNCCMCLMV